MVPLQALGDGLSEWLTTLAILSAPGAAATLLWTPFLAARRVRSLFRELPPTESLVPTYVLVGLGASVPFVAGFFGLLVGTDVDVQGGGMLLSKRLFTMTLLLTVGYTVGTPLVGILGVRKAGVDWDPTGYGATTWLLLAAGGLWYALVFAVPLVLSSIVLGLPGGY